jgi:DNA-directed RNA polymerase specialized sigma24 family protein/CheY-like chemotaxis protein
MFRGWNKIPSRQLFRLESEGNPMKLGQTIAGHLPFLRRYARAITGSQGLGDMAVREMLEAIALEPSEFNENNAPRLEIFRLFHRIWNAETIQPIEIDIEGSISGLTVKTRQALLLTMVEGFSIAETCEILQCDVEEIERLIAEAREALASGLDARVMIIEDEPIIAIHLQSIVNSLDYEVVGIARTRREAVALSQDAVPDLILADISLADGSSGIDAAIDILKERNVPIIFITAFPERLLTGERPEPTYLITKPFEPETVTATIWQALLVSRENERSLASAA